MIQRGRFVHCVPVRISPVTVRLHYGPKPLDTLLDDQIDQLPQGPPKPVEARHHQHVALPTVIHRRTELGPVFLAAEDLVLEDPLAAIRLKRHPLYLQTMISLVYRTA